LVIITLSYSQKYDFILLIDLKTVKNTSLVYKVHTAPKTKDHKQTG